MTVRTVKVQKKSTIFSAALIAAVITGLVLGTAFPPRAEAANFWEFWYDIPAEWPSGTSVYLNCGWHTGSCLDENSGPALDWDANSDANLYFAGGMRWNGSYLTQAAYVESLNAPNFNGSACNNVVAPMQNWYTGNVESVQVYTHGTTPGVTITIWAYSTAWVVRDSIGVAVNEGEDLPGCPTTGRHMYVYGFLGMVGTNWAGYPDVSQCTDDACLTYNNQTWVHYDSWNY